MLHLFCFLYHFQGIQPESGQKNEKSGITDSRTSQHLRADRMSGKEMKMPAKRQQPPLLHHSPKTETPAMRSQTLTKSHAARASFAPMRHFPESLSAEWKIIRLKAIFQCPQNLRATCTKRRKNDFLPWRRDAESPVFPPTWKPESLKKEKQNESGNARRKDI